MLYEKSAGTIVFRREKERIRYLLLYKKVSGHYRETWDFPKGNIEKGEDEKQTARREAEEETGIKDLRFTPGFKERIKFFYKKEGELVLKEIFFYLAETLKKKVILSFEHNDYKWLLFEEAESQLTFKNSKEILKRANKFLQKKLKIEC